MGRIDLLFELERDPPQFYEPQKKYIHAPKQPRPRPPAPALAPLLVELSKKEEPTMPNRGSSSRNQEAILEKIEEENLSKKEEPIKSKSGSPSRNQEEILEKIEAEAQQACLLQEYGWKEEKSEHCDDHVTGIYKDYDLYIVAAKNGNLDDFKRVLDRVSAADNLSFGDILCRLSPARNTFLHVAAKHGNVDIVNFVAVTELSLVLSKNFKEETALHLAVKAGDESMVKALLLIHQELLVSKPLPQNEGDENNLLRAKNNRGNTALHEALFNGWGSIAECLIKEEC